MDLDYHLDSSCEIDLADFTLENFVEPTEEISLMIDNLYSGLNEFTIKYLIPQWMHLMGPHKGLISIRVATIDRVMRKILKRMLKEERDTVEDMKSQVDQIEEERVALERELFVSIPAREDMLALPLIQRKDKLDELLESFREVRRARLKRLNEIQRADAELHGKLGQPPVYNKVKGVLKEERLEEMEKEVSKVRQVLNGRRETAIQCLEEIKSLLSELEIVCLSTAERKALKGELPLTPEHLDFLEDWRCSLIDRRREERRMVVELKEKIHQLWTRLDEAAEYREEFEKKIADRTCGAAALASLGGELERCEQLKRENLGRIVDEIRDKIARIWEECGGATPDGNARLAALRTEEIDETSLERHEVELETVTLYADHTKKLRCVWDKWGKLLKQRIGMEEGQLVNVADRLKNRGGMLLKEERARKKIDLELPAREEEMRTLAAEFRDKFGYAFAYRGKDVDGAIAEADAEFQELKAHIKGRLEEARKNLNAGNVGKNAVGGGMLTPGKLKRAKSSANITTRLGAKRAKTPLKECAIPPGPATTGTAPAMTNKFGYRLRRSASTSDLCMSNASYSDFANQVSKNPFMRSSGNTGKTAAAAAMALPQLTNSANKRKGGECSAKRGVIITKEDDKPRPKTPGNSRYKNWY